MCLEYLILYVCQVAGIVWDGENEELRSLILGAADLEKKLLKALEEVKRLELKTDTLIRRQRDLEEAISIQFQFNFNFSIFRRAG